MSTFLPIPTLIPSPLVNGNRYDYSSVQIQVNGFPLLGQEVVAVDYKHGLKPSSVFGSSPRKLGRTRGQYEADATLEITKESYGTLVAALSQNPLFGYMEASFQIDVVYQDVSHPTSIQDTLLGCRIVEESEGHKASGDGLTVRVTLDVIEIQRDGIPAIAEGVTI